MFWGYSSAIDILEEIELNGITDNCIESADDEEKEEAEYNILLIGQSDCRHILKTMAKKYQHKKKVKMNFFVNEALMENVARDLLFLVIGLEPPESIGLTEKTKFFMDLYGNTVIRPATSNYLSSVSEQLLLMVTDEDYAQKVLPLLSLNQLKYKERDQLEIILKYWASKDSFDILTVWDERVRKFLGVRYDSKYGAFDWDYHMRYLSYGAKPLNIQEYKRFRERGISFYSEDTDPCITNRTLASAIMLNGSKIINYGYLGDIVTGPYATFGFECEEPKMLERVNGYSKKTATDITEYNIMSMFHEIINKEPFSVPHVQDESHAILTEDTSAKLKVRSQTQDDSKIRRKNFLQSDYKLLTIDNCKVIFLSTSALKNPSILSKYNNFFDVVTMPQVMVLKYFTSDLIKMIKLHGLIIVDTPKYLLSYRKEDLEKYKLDVEQLMKQNNCKNLSTSFSYSSDEFMKFQVIK